jgi:excisionase family DNA binding protein
MAEPAPLAAAAARLRGTPGRPRRGETDAAQAAIERIRAATAKARATRASRKVAATEAIIPRLLDLEQSAKYLSCSPWTLRDLIANGTLPRVRVPLPSGADLRKILVDREDLDRLIASWKDSR